MALSDWLTKWLTNKWMNNVTYRASVAHALFGYALIITLDHYELNSPLGYLLLLGFVAIKEFWYDAKYELPKQTATDNWLDFGMYALGGLIGLIVTLT